ncbi:biotin/lipoyl-containing protein, partial [Actinoalloteichus caeruleus]
EVDEPLLEVSTDKVDTEIPSPAAGVLRRIIAQEDETVEVGAELAQLDDGSGEEPASAPAAQEQPAESPAPTPQPAEQPAPAPQPAASGAGNGGGSAEGTSVEMPALGESVTEGTVTRWLKNVGDS